MKAPEKGSILIMDFDPQAGHEQMKRRPALVLSPASFNQTFGLALVAPITSKPKGHGFEIALPTGCGATGSIMLHQIKTLDWVARKARRVGNVPPHIVTAAAEIIKAIID